MVGMNYIMKTVGEIFERNRYFEQRIRCYKK